MMKQNDAAFSAEHRQYIARLNRSRRGIKLARWLILIVFIALWELFARVGIIDPFIGSSPVRVAETIARLYAGGELFLHIGVTLYETVLGFVLGTAAGTLIAIMLWWSPAINRVLDPYLVVLNALPKIALGPILIVWFGAGITSIIVMALLISFVVTIMSVLAGFNEITGEKAAAHENAWRKQAANIHNGGAARVAADYYERAEDKRWHELGWRYSRGIPCVKGRPWLSYSLRRAGIQAGSCYGEHSGAVPACGAHVLRRGIYGEKACKVAYARRLRDAII